MNYSAHCPLCGVETGDVLASELRRGTGIVFHCADCDLGFLIQESPFDAKAHYAGPYREAASPRDYCSRPSSPARSAG